MKKPKINILLLLCFLVTLKASANTYYVSTTGNDANPGTINAPFATWDRLSSIMVAGDIAYIRGGIYHSGKPATTDTQVRWQNMNGTSTDSIKIFAYPGEYPIMDLSDVLHTTAAVYGLYIQNCNYVWIKGLRITGLAQNTSGNVLWGLILVNSNNCRIEACEVDNIGGQGFFSYNSNDILYKNCDAHHCDDRYSSYAWNGSNGFSATGGGNTSTRNTYDGCRAWWISDDGWDFYGTDGYFTVKNCWSFWNGFQPGTFIPAGDGVGYKLGPTGSNMSTSLLRSLNNNVSAENRSLGFDQNGGNCMYQLQNNIAYNNGDAGFMWGYFPSIPQVAKNNVSYHNYSNYNGAEITGDHNSWNGGVSLSNADFLSVTTASLLTPRLPDGSLPDIPFLHLDPTSDLIDRGVDVGLPYSGAAPDMGAYEFNTGNINPIANAGTDQTITLPVSILTLSGSGTDADGSIASYEWRKIAGPLSVTIVLPNQASTLVIGLGQGVYQFELKVTDNLGGVDRDTVFAYVNAAPNQPPAANAGPDQNITLPVNNVTLNGSGNDPDGTIAAYQWTKIAGPAGNIVSPTQASTVINTLTQGVYQFELKVTDNQGATGKDTVIVTVNPAPNQPPVANAGPDRNITLPTNSLTLNGSGSDPDGTITAYLWTKISGPTSFNIVSSTQSSTLINTLSQGVYQFELKVTDNQGATGKDTVTVTVNPAPPNQAPIANAGINQNITLPTNSLTLNGSGNDPDGTITTYQWTKISGPTSFSIVSPTQASTVINTLVQGVYEFELKVTDNQGATGKDTVMVTVNAAPPNQAPTANAGINQNITLPTNSLTLNGSGNDPDGTITAYQWTKISGPTSFNIVSPTQASTVINTLVQGVYEFELRVTDNQGATGKDTVMVTVNAAPPNQAPTANAGINQNITLPTNSLTLNGSGNDPDGTITAYQWTKISGPASFNIVSPTQASTVINTLVQGVYEFELKVTDNQGATGKDTVMVTVNAAPPNQAPTANAGINQNITLPTNSLTLNGSGNDPDGTITAYQWTKISGPASFNIVSPTQASTVINALVQGVYEFELKVTDNQGATGKDTVIVTVNAAPNQAPTANAGINQNITLPTNSVTLNGSGNDPDGTVVSYQWTKIAGPTSFNIVSPAQASTVINTLAQGVYQFELKVTDNQGAIGKDTVIVTVNAAPPNQAPTANAGLNQNITLPVNTVTLNGSGNDPDGTIVSYQWTKIAGPASFNIISPTQASTVINTLVQGVYQFELKVTDNGGAIGKDTVIVTVNAAPNQPPTANAGLNQNITLPVNTLTLTGSGTDPDGTITAYLWTKISGPSVFNIVSPTQATTVINGLIQGVYQFELKVTDNGGATQKDTVVITVNAAAVANQAPVVKAGNSIVIVLPVNTTTLKGTGSDADGTIVSYNWTKISGPLQADIKTPTSVETTVENLVEGVYVFQLKATDNAGATGVDTVQVTVQKALTFSTSIFPNPVTSTMNLKIEEKTVSGSATLYIYDMTGKIIYQESFTRNGATVIKQVNVATLLSGTYIVRVVSDSNAQSIKMVKQ